MSRHGHFDWKATAFSIGGWKQLSLKKENTQNVFLWRVITHQDERLQTQRLTSSQILPTYSLPLMHCAGFNAGLPWQHAIVYHIIKIIQPSLTRCCQLHDSRIQGAEVSWSQAVDPKQSVDQPVWMNLLSPPCPSCPNGPERGLGPVWCRTKIPHSSPLLLPRVL